MRSSSNTPVNDQQDMTVVSHNNPGLVVPKAPRLASFTSLARSKALVRSCKKATMIRRQQEKNRRRLRDVMMMCLVRVDNDVGRRRHHQDSRAFTQITHEVVPSVSSPCAFTHDDAAAAMAPANTTQYLMAMADDQFDFQPGSSSTTTTASSSSSPPGLYGEDSSVYDADGYDACLAFQQRSFESELAELYPDNSCC